MHMMKQKQMRDEYEFDYADVRRNSFVPSKSKGIVISTSKPGVAEVFDSSKPKSRSVTARNRSSSRTAGRRTAAKKP